MNGQAFRYPEIAILQCRDFAGAIYGQKFFTALFAAAFALSLLAFVMVISVVLHFKDYLRDIKYNFKGDFADKTLAVLLIGVPFYLISIADAVCSYFWR